MCIRLCTVLSLATWHYLLCDMLFKRDARILGWSRRNECGSTRLDETIGFETRQGLAFAPLPACLEPSSICSAHHTSERERKKKKAVKKTFQDQKAAIITAPPSLGVAADRKITTL